MKLLIVLEFVSSLICYSALVCLNLRTIAFELIREEKLKPDTWKCPPERPLVTTNSGSYCGLREIVHWPDGLASKVDVYYGIRYGQPPIGPLRFHKPIPPKPEPMKTFSVKDLPPTCPQPEDTMFQDSPAARMWQPNTPMSEDCLFLNIWVPSEKTVFSNGTFEKLAVMLWIYGGSFYTGTSTLSVYDGRFLAARQNIIVASMNYRIGPLGFLYTESPKAPGNVGLWDQRLAMKWIKDHIAYFGGDPGRITLFGESAGGVSVSTHVISPWSHAYFTNAIMQSGSIFSNWAVVTSAQALERTRRFEKILQCMQTYAEDRLECLRKKTVQEILDAHDAMFDASSYFSVPFPPVLDNHFLPYQNGKELALLTYLKPNGALVFGMNKNEGSYFLLYAFVNNSHWYGDKTQLPIESRADYLRCLRRVLDLNDDVRPEFTEQLIRYVDFEYETYEHLGSLASWTERLEAISSDRSFKCPTIKMAKTITRPSHDTGFEQLGMLPVYFYELRHRTQSLPWPEWAGTMHGYEIEYVFGIPFSPHFQATFYRFTDEERRLSDMIMTYWGNFARTGDPNILPGGKHVVDLNQAMNEETKAMESEHDSQRVVNYLTRVKLPVSLSKCVFSGWPQYKNETGAYLVFKEEPGQITVRTEPRKRQCIFWYRLYPMLLQQTEQNREQCDANK